MPFILSLKSVFSQIINVILCTIKKWKDIKNHSYPNNEIKRKKLQQFTKRVLIKKHIKMIHLNIKWKFF